MKRIPVSVSRREIVLGTRIAMKLINIMFVVVFFFAFIIIIII